MVAEEGNQLFRRMLVQIKMHMRILRKFRLVFASVVRSGGKGRPDEDGNEANSEDKNATPEEKEEEENISIQKLPNGLYNIVIPEEVKSKLRKDWWKTLIVKLFERKIFLSAIQRRLQAMWGRMGSIKVIDIGNEFFLVKFFNSKDLDFAIMEGPWKISDHYLTIPLLKPDFNSADATIDNIVVWIRLPDHAIEYYDRAILEKIGGIVGRIIKVDSNTAQIS
nr:uncharacterized protein LOC112790332 isoform X1 [Arachis hypogaea]